MLKDNNYRFEVKASLQIMREQRNALCSSSLDTGSKIYLGLHELKSEIRSLYFQYYLTEWFDAHWSTLESVLDRHLEYTKDQQKLVKLFFAEFFVKFLENYDSSGIMAKIMIPDLLKSELETLKDLIELDGKFEDNYNKIKIEIKKHDEE
ncbi:MAG: hypothetical protein K2K06_09040, partial [Oscillospiraceae bacterium]|nr:hypothetical protein [Oscillospiraceae bacterium]